MELTVVQHKVIGVNLKPSQEKDSEKEFNLQYEPHFYEKDKKKFDVIFNINLLEPNQYHLTLKYKTTFKTSNDINEKFKKSHFPFVNAPAIGFPFLRSFVSFMILNAGYSPLILPSINFINLFESNRKKSKQTKPEF